MTVGQSIDYLNPGDFIKIPPGNKHQILNESLDEVLVFVTIYEMNESKILNDSDKKDVHRTNLIVSSYPTPNGDLHPGHISGPFLPSDIMHRANIVKGEKSHFFTGTLGHQNHVDIAAKKGEMTYYDFASKMSRKIKQSMHGMKIHPTVFLGPMPDSDFMELNNSIFSFLYEKKLIIRKNSPVIVDSESGRICSETVLPWINFAYFFPDQACSPECQAATLLPALREPQKKRFIVKFLHVSCPEVICLRTCP